MAQGREGQLAYRDIIQAAIGDRAAPRHPGLSCCGTKSSSPSPSSGESVANSIWADAWYPLPGSSRAGEPTFARMNGKVGPKTDFRNPVFSFDPSGSLRSP
jgi:hypothetical protein